MGRGAWRATVHGLQIDTTERLRRAHSKGRLNVYFIHPWKEYLFSKNIILKQYSTW